MIKLPIATLLYFFLHRIFLNIISFVCFSARERIAHRLNRSHTFNFNRSSTREIANQWFANYKRFVGMRTVYHKIQSFLVSSAENYYCRTGTRNGAVFSNESRFCWDMHHNRDRVKIRRDIWRDSHFAVEKHMHCTVGIMVWGVYRC